MSPRFVIGILVSIVATLVIVNKGIVFGNAISQNNQVVVSEGMPYQSISPAIQMRSDRDGNVTLADLTSDLYSSQFAFLQSPTVNLGYSDAVYWFRVLLNNNTRAPVDVMLDMPFPLLDSIEGYLVKEDLSNLNVIRQFRFGDRHRFSERPFTSPSFVQPLTLPAEPVWLFLRVQTSSPVHVPVYLASDNAYAEYITIKQWLSGILYGIALALACYNFMLFLALRDKTYFYYSMFIVALFLFYACVDGYSFYLWKDNVEWQSKAHIYFIYLALAFGIEFSRLFLSIGQSQRLLMQHTRTLIGVCVACIFATPFLQEVYAATLMSTISGICLTYMFAVGIVRLRDGVPMAGLYVIVWGLLMVTAFMNVLGSNGLLFDFMDVNGYMKVASVFELLLLSFGVGSKINTIREKQIRAERHALHFSEEARRAEKLALDIEREANRTLEERVTERTRQLEVAMRDLHRANDELKRLSETDSLTGLYNRRKFEDECNERIDFCRREEALVAFMFIDIDHFKRLNDTHGHNMGDLCLQEVADVLMNLAEKFGFLVARFGGEEFALVTMVNTLERASELGEIVRAEIEKIRIPNNDDICITVSVGCYVQTPPPIAERSVLMKKADIALYRAKASGRNCVVLEHPFKSGDQALAGVPSLPNKPA
ncbi:MAG: diguanylate cyclase [Ketobacteraceae bacterium]|nr:diguanylate cyclase [Ketobacteraceae bacterium]